MSGERSGPRFRILARERVHDGFYRLDVLTLTHERFLGGWTKPLRRELLVQRPAVAVLPYDPMQDLVVLVEQFRTGRVDHPGEPWLVEAVAGLVEPGEPAAAVAAREVDEETGLAIGRTEFVCRYHASPGGTSEQVDVFLAEVYAGAGGGGVFGMAHEDEDIRTLVLPATEAFAMVADGRIIAANSIIPLLWLQLHRDRLRAEWRRAAA